MVIVDGERIGRVRPHVELADAEVDGIGTCLDGGGQTFARPHRGHDFKIVDIVVHIFIL